MRIVIEDLKVSFEFESEEEKNTFLESNGFAELLKNPKQYRLTDSEILQLMRKLERNNYIFPSYIGKKFTDNERKRSHEGAYIPFPSEYPCEVDSSDFPCDATSDF